MKPVLFLINSTGGLTNVEAVDNQCWAGLVVGDGCGIRVFQPNPSQANATLIESMCSIGARSSLAQVPMRVAPRPSADVGTEEVVSLRGDEGGGSAMRVAPTGYP